MARPLRIEYAGAIYHVTARMVGSGPEGPARLFRDEQDYRRFEEQLAQRIEDFGVRLYLYCLMPNHYHLVVETPQGNLSRFMQSLATAYTVYFNLRHRRHGHLFDGRFKAKVVSGDEYLLRLSRYVHLNPVRAKRWAKQGVTERIRHLETYLWSSYPGYVRKSKQRAFVEEGPVLAMIGGSANQKAKDYRQYVNKGLVETDEELLEAMTASQYGIGELEFRQGLERQGNRKAKSKPRKEDVSFRKRADTLAVKQVMKTAGLALGMKPEEFVRKSRGTQARAILARCLTRHAGQTQREAAELLGVKTGAAVNIQLRKLNESAANDKRLQRTLKQLDQEFERQRTAQPSSSKKKNKSQI